MCSVQCPSQKRKEDALAISISDTEAYVSVFIRSHLPIDTASRLHQSLRDIPGNGSSGQQEKGVGCDYEDSVDQEVLSSTIYALLEREGLMDSMSLSMTPFWRTRVQFNPAYPVEWMRQRYEQLAQLQDV